MPKTKIDKYRVGKRDCIKGLILEFMAIQGISISDLSAKSGIPNSTLHRKFSQHTDKWTMEEICTVCRTLKIQSEDLRNTIRL